MIRVAINGFGRIGRSVFKAGINDKKIKFVAVNDLSDTKTLAYLIQYDSVYGRFNGKIQAKEHSLIVNGKSIQVLSERDPEKLPWKKLNIDIVVESTGIFREKKDALKHIKAGAKRVILSAPSESADFTVVLGVNEEKLRKEHQVISMASCTTNCLAPLVKVLDDNFKVKQGFMNTVHAYTSSQALVDGPARKLRRGRSAALSIVPTTSGATEATTLALPHLKGKLDGLALRVPVACGSIVDFSAVLEKKASVKDINAAFQKAARGKLKGILGYTEDEIVSQDIIGQSYSSLIDGKSTQIINGNFVKVLSWYDNEFGYSVRVIDLIRFLGKFR
ncbi:type I glyceraldehyde-3-phosphate dehydrogenase [Candidatus Woesearchaeota archaeon]|nr:type I glyceraldehyde-3-phosphate dehydrogenase [Candidatus Woesearchaeota archaeon]